VSQERTRSVVRVLDGLETGFMVLLIALLLAAGLTQFVLRNLFHTGVLWLEPFSRYLVLWIAFAGALRAVGEERHIRIDILPRLLHGNVEAVISVLTSFAAAAICAVLTKSGISFLAMERDFGTIAFLSLPTWGALAVIPLGFAAIGIRFAWKGTAKLAYVVQGMLHPSVNPTTPDSSAP
jgi:TRAP-type C4-dicarboxylate transport system permease small subunit